MALPNNGLDGGIPPETAAAPPHHMRAREDWDEFMLHQEEEGPGLLAAVPEGEEGEGGAQAEVQAVVRATGLRPWLENVEAYGTYGWHAPNMPLFLYCGVCPWGGLWL